MNNKIANNIMAFGVALFVVGLLIIVFSPTNLTILTRTVLGTSGPIGTIVSFVGLVLFIAGGYSKMN